ncbi:MAG: bifunctional alpha,alpha-trehalose-phosphate synthase (UDP-forming)/trehalose-phosphatase [Clostridia bacterium]|nr:bifunctional alpha,alpha-trehalose-phosphate synthase (UDP-forming)/trehalose-phosphatase [Clostridia bacterium]
MSKLIFISNRLPVTIKQKDNGFEYEKSIGGLATGLKSYHEQSNSVWVGWPGIPSEDLNADKELIIEKDLGEQFNCLPVFMSEKEVEDFYYGFCNRTIWPLFHYFTNKTEYDRDQWSAYKRVNKKFFSAAEKIIEDGDIIWIHDYQLMLLPQIIRAKFPNTKIGFFLHIPFPSFEIFRLMVWRKTILKGLLGADLIGLHTYDYVRHFLSSVRRLLGYEHNLNRITYEDRYVQVDAFPMGIDYARFSKKYTNPEFLRDEKDVIESIKGGKMVLSIDRLDYTKGIPERIKAFDAFLTKYPEYKGNVRLHLIVAPSRVAVNTYENLRSEISELVSNVNGRHGTMNWMPIWFYFQSFSQESLIALYKHADVLLVTPLRDGMNLVSKEYIASRPDLDGMVVISETAGAASELSEVVVVNANDINAIATGIKKALDMSKKDKKDINTILHKRLKRYNVNFWADDFLAALKDVSSPALPSEIISLENDHSPVLDAYNHAKSRLIFLDYDGTLVGFKSMPHKAKPDKDLKELLRKFTMDEKNTVIIVSGRDRYTLDAWLGDLRVHMLATHGLWWREYGGEWSMTASLDNSWKESVFSVMQKYADRMPGALIEEKDYSLAFHYRQCEPDMVAVKMWEVQAALSNMIQSMNLSLLEGNKVFEIKDNRVNKGQSASNFIRSDEYDFIMGMGDDRTDEDLFAALPERAYSIKVGLGATVAKYRVSSWKSVRALIKRLVK